MIPLNPDILPAELRETPCFVTYVAVPSTTKNGAARVDKIPKNPRTGSNARANNPSTWSDISTACSAVKRFGHSGIGIEFYRDYPYWGVDLDHCRDSETGELAPWAQVIVDRFQPYCYIEPSPSRTGLHIIGRGAKPSWTTDESKKGGRRKGPIEFYPGGQFLTLTLDPLFPCITLIDCTDTLAAWLNDTLEEPTPTPKTQPIAPTLSVADDELLKQCMRGERFRRLHAGDDRDYDDDTSRADLGFLDTVVLNHGTREQADKLFRQSERMHIQPKWDRADYVRRTLNKAFDGKVIPSSPGPRRAANGHAPTPMPQDAALVPDDAPCDLKLGAALRELERLRQENARLVAQKDQIEEHNRILRGRVQCADEQLAAYRNPKLGAAKAVGAALIEIFRNQEPDRPDDPAGYRMPLSRLADKLGLSEDACSRQGNQLGTYTTPDGVPAVYWKTINVPAGLNTITGEMDAETGPHKEVWVGPGVAREEFAAMLATLDPEARKPWGGKTEANTCVDHPEDGVIERTSYLQKTTYECATCNETLLEQIVPVAGRHPKIRHLAAIPMPQDAASTLTTSSSVDSLYPRKMRHRETAPLFLLEPPPLTQAEIEHAYAYAKGGGS